MEFDKQEFKSEFEKCKLNPYDYIKGWMEKNLMHVGSRVFRVLALQPCSLAIPNIHFISTDIRSSFNVLFIAPPSSGKSTICRKYAEICFNPYEVRKVSSSQLADDLANKKLFTLIMEDFSQIGNDYDVIKVVEGAIGDEQKISKRNKRTIVEEKVRGVGLMCGTWDDLGRYLKYFKSGLLFRNYILFLDLTQKEKEEIAKYVNTNIGNKKNKEENEIEEYVVKSYYEEIFKILGGENPEIPQIKGYHLDVGLKADLFNTYKDYTKKYEENNKGIEFNFTRELHEGYRFVISSAILNIFNRKVEKEGVIYPNKEDFEIGKSLMIENLKNKISILKSRHYLKSIKSLGDLKEALKDDRVPTLIKKILINLSRYSS